MSANVESMLSVNEVPWHGLGVILDSPPTPADAIRIAGLDWEVKLKQLYAHPDLNDAFVWPSPRQVSAFATTRATDGKVLGIVGPNYTVVQNTEAFAFFQPFIDSGTCKIETAGSLRGGRRIWVLARIEEDPTEILKGDEIRRYTLMSNSHDGTLAVRVGFTGIRAVCENTLT